jgi:hypothetical protein
LAIFIIVTGALLMVGGAIALLFGFDIVMTERGSAMVIGGTVTLSGGAIATGIGFALHRLNQILRVLQQKNATAPRGISQQDRPTVPMSTNEPVTLPQAASTQASLPSLTGMAATGAAVAVGGLALAGHKVFSQADTDLPAPQEASASKLDAIAMAVEAPSISNDPALIATPTAVHSTPDLEAELSRALAETDHVADRDSQFTAGLSEFLSKPRSETSVEPSTDVPNEISPQDDAVKIKLDIAAEEQSAFDDEVQTKDDGSLYPILTQLGDETSPESNDDDDKNLNMDMIADKFDQVVENHAFADDEKNQDSAATPDSSRPAILRTYNAGGKLYTMYIDGSVEAITDEGIERFATMEEFRTHLGIG